MHATRSGPGSRSGPRSGGQGQGQAQGQGPGQGQDQCQVQGQGQGRPQDQDDYDNENDDDASSFFARGFAPSSLFFTQQPPCHVKCGPTVIKVVVAVVVVVTKG